MRVMDAITKLQDLRGEAEKQGFECELSVEVTLIITATIVSGDEPPVDEEAEPPVAEKKPRRKHRKKASHPIRLKDILFERDITGREFAAAIGETEEAVSRMLNGCQPISEPRKHRILRWCFDRGIPAEGIFDVVGKGKPGGEQRDD